MKTYIENEKEIPVYASVDVLVVGGGPSGFGAAVSAARMGVNTLLIESSAAIGGVATSGMMSHWTGQVEGPILDELLQRTKDIDRDFEFNKGKILKGINIINTDKTKLEMLEMLNEANAKWRLLTTFSDVIMDGSKVTGVIVESKAGREAIFAKVVIDATGDGDVATRAGCKFWIGRESDSAVQPMSVMFKVGGVDYNKAIFPGEFIDHISSNSGVSIQNLGSKELESPIGHVLLYPNTLPSVVTVNMTNSINKDGTSPDDITKADFECRRQIPKIVNFLKRNAPGYEKCYLMATAPQIGVRETRHIEGYYIFNEDDILKGRVFDDWIVTRCWFFFDLHNVEGPGLDSKGEVFQKTTNYFTMPYRSFVPLGVDSLYIVGRSISGTHMAHSAYRIMPICVNMGQGVGTSAAYCVKNNLEPKDVDVKNVQTLLIDQGVKI